MFMVRFAEEMEWDHNWLEVIWIVLVYSIPQAHKPICLQKLLARVLFHGPSSGGFMVVPICRGSVSSDTNTCPPPPREGEEWRGRSEW